MAREDRLARIIRAELDQMPCPIRCCTIAELKARPEMLDRSVVCGHLSIASELIALVPPGQSVLILRYNVPQDCVARIRGLKQASQIALVSISPHVLETARLVFSPHVGSIHLVREHVVAEPVRLSGLRADLIFCDWIVYQSLSERDRQRFVLHRIVSEESAGQIRAALDA